LTKAQALKLARERIGGFSEPSKMPGLSYSIPASECKVGQILAQRKGTVCHGCYALKGRYLFPTVKNCLTRRAEIVRQNPEQWADNVIELLPYASPDVKDFRWHDSGDLQGIDHLKAIVRIARELPEYRFWLPSKEYALIRAYVSSGESIPDNLIIRLSAPLLGDTSFKSVTGFVSYVADSGANCPAPSQGGKCADCRNCWDKNVPVIVYKRH
jgi:hypothetical protein